MPTKRYRLLQNHPYADKGTIVEEVYRNNHIVDVVRKIPDNCLLEVSAGDMRTINGKQHFVIVIPLSVMDTWLEEVKEVTFTREQAEAIRAQLKAGKELSFNHWLSAHTSTEE